MKVIESNLFSCVNCIKDNMTTEQVKEHMANEHDLDIACVSGKRTMLMHADARDYYKYVFEWEFGDVKLLQSIIQECQDKSGW